MLCVFLTVPRGFNEGDDCAFCGENLNMGSGCIKGDSCTIISCWGWFLQQIGNHTIDNILRNTSVLCLHVCVDMCICVSVRDRVHIINFGNKVKKKRKTNSQFMNS